MASLLPQNGAATFHLLTPSWFYRESITGQNFLIFPRRKEANIGTHEKNGRDNRRASCLEASAGPFNGDDIFRSPVWSLIKPDRPAGGLNPKAHSISHSLTPVKSLGPLNHTAQGRALLGKSAKLPIAWSRRKRLSSREELGLEGTKTSEPMRQNVQALLERNARLPLGFAHEPPFWHACKKRKQEEHLGMCIYIIYMGTAIVDAQGEAAGSDHVCSPFFGSHF